MLLYLCGMFYHGGLSHTWPDVRFSGVLNRIALDYFFAAVLFCFFKPRALVGICAGLLIGYWALMTFVSIRDIQLTREHLAMLAEKAGDTNLVAQFRDKTLTNPTTVKEADQVWAATKTMFYGPRIGSAANLTKDATYPNIWIFNFYPATSMPSK